MIIEFESEWPQEKLYASLSKISLLRLQYNGGSYIAHFPETISVNNFLTLCIEDQIPIKYFRNISDSTRRFFI